MELTEMKALVERHLKAEGAGDVEGRGLHRRHRARRGRLPGRTVQGRGEGVL